MQQCSHDGIDSGFMALDETVTMEQVCIACAARLRCCRESCWHMHQPAQALAVQTCRTSAVTSNSNEGARCQKSAYGHSGELSGMAVVLCTASADIVWQVQQPTQALAIQSLLRKVTAKFSNCCSSWWSLSLLLVHLVALNFRVRRKKI